MSSRLKPNVICVRSFVPKLKNSAISPISSATKAARGTSIIVPTEISSLPLYFFFSCTSAIVLADLIRQHRKLAGGTDERDHDLGLSVDLLLLARDHGFGDGGDLHLENLRIRDRQAATTMSEHRIHLVQLVDALLHVGGRDAEFLRHLGLRLGFVRQEFVQRRIQAGGSSPAGHPSL